MHMLESLIFLTMEGDHNSKRPEHFLKDVEKFFLRTLHLHVDMVKRGGRQQDRCAQPSTPVAPPSPWCPVDTDSPVPPPTPYGDEGMYVPIPVPQAMPPSADEMRQRQQDRRDELLRQSDSSPDHSRHDQRDMRKSLLDIGFAPKQVDAAMQRNSTLEGCVDWIVANGG